MFYETDSEQEDSCPYGYDVEELDQFETAMFDPFGDMPEEETTYCPWEDLKNPDNNTDLWNAIIDCRDFLLTNIQERSRQNTHLADEAMKVLRAIQKLCKRLETDKNYKKTPWFYSLHWTMGIMIVEILPFITGTKAELRQMHKLSRDTLDVVKEQYQYLKSLPNAQCSTSVEEQSLLSPSLDGAAPLFTKKTQFASTREC